MKAFNSIKWKLLVWQTVLLAGVLATLLTLHYQFHKRNLIAAVDAELQETLLAVMPIIAPPQQNNMHHLIYLRHLMPCNIEYLKYLR